MIQHLYETLSAPIREAKDKRILRNITDEVMAVVEKHPHDETASEEENEKRLERVELEIFKAKLRWQEKHPKRLEEAELLFGLPHFFSCARRAQADRGVDLSFPTVRENLSDIAEYSVTMTHFLATNVNDRAYLKDFWRAVERVAFEGHTTSHTTFESITNGWRGQAAAFHILEKLNLKPHHPTPTEDVMKATDLNCHLPWQQKPARVQVKAEKSRKRPTLLALGKHGRALTELGPKEQTNIRQITRPRVRMVVLRLPTHAIDPVTATPDEKLIDQCRGKIEELRGILKIPEEEN